jgi:Domain of unknown function DUF29
LGRSDLRLARSLCRHIIEHLLKPNFPGFKKPAHHWRDEIVECASKPEQILTRNIETKLDFPGCYKAALRLVRLFKRKVAVLLSRLLSECPYTIEQIAGTGGEDRFPPPCIPYA